MALTNDLGALRDRTILPGLYCLQSRISTTFRPGSLVAHRLGSKLAEVPLSASKRTDLVIVGTFIGREKFAASSSDDGDGGSLDADGNPEQVQAEGGAVGWFATGSGADEITDDDIGEACYAYDDDTLYLTDLAGTLSFAGLVHSVRSDGRVKVSIRPDLVHGFGPAAGLVQEEPAAGTNLTDADQTLVITGGNWRKMLAGVAGAARTKTLGTTGAVAGNVFQLTIHRQPYAISVVNGGAAPGTTVIPANSAGVSLRYQFDGTDWILKSFGDLALDEWVTGTALTDTATTTVQRGGKRTSFLLAGTMSQGETVTLGTTGAVAGDIIRIIRTSTSAQTCAVVNGGVGAGTLVTLPASKVNFAEARFDGTNWLFHACGVQ